MAVEQPVRDPWLAERIEYVFGAVDDSMDAVEARAEELAPLRAIVWEGDAATFAFRFVSKAAEEILGYPLARWTDEPTFWPDVVVHPDDRDEAVAHYALCTGKGEGGELEYRAVARDGQVLRIQDVVRVILGDKGIATRLRGVMMAVDEHARLADESRGGE